MSDTVQLTDQFLLASSMKADPIVRTSKGKRVIAIPDGNQGSYGGGLVTIDATNQLNGSQGAGSLREAYLTVPYVITARNTSANAGTIGVLNRFVCGLKCNVANVIDSLEVELNGKSILTHSEYKGYWNNLRAMTETSMDDVYKHAPETFLGSDDWYSINFDATANSGTGDGYSNNSTITTVQLDSSGSQSEEPRSFNSGFLSRLMSTPVPADGANNGFKWASQGALGTPLIVAQSGRGCFVRTAAATQGRIAGTWIYMLKIRLVDLHPLFKDLDLICNPQFRLRFRVNQGTVAVSGTATTMKLDSSTVLGSTCPIMISSAAAGSHMTGVLASDRQLSFSYGVLQNSFSVLSAEGAPPLNSYLPYNTTRLHVPFYDLVDMRALISKPIKTIRYLDCASQYFKGRAGTGAPISGLQSVSFNLQLSATLKNIKYVAVMPFADTTTGHFATATGVEQFQSPFDSAPWTFQPGSYIRNFQVTIGNQNVFAKTHEYDYETFSHEFAKLGAVNGDMTREMNCGLVDLDRWTYAQRVMVADCSRISDKDVPASIQVSGTNACSQATNLLVLVVYERELDIDRVTGEVTRFD